MRKLQHTSITWDSWRRQAAASKLSIVSSFNSRIPVQFAYRRTKKFSVILFVFLLFEIFPLPSFSPPLKNFEK